MSNDGDAGWFGDRLNRAFDEVRDAHGRPYHNSWLARQAGLQESYVGRLRRGSGPPPRIDTVRDIARAFGLDASYFLPPTEGSDTADEAEQRLRRLAEDNPDLRGQVELALALRAAGVNRVAGRGALSTEKGRLAVARLVAQVERLPEPEVDRVRRVVEAMTGETDSDGDG